MKPTLSRLFWTNFPYIIWGSDQYFAKWPSWDGTYHWHLPGFLCDSLLFICGYPSLNLIIFLFDVKILMELPKRISVSIYKKYWFGFYESPKMKLYFPVSGKANKNSPRLSSLVFHLNFTGYCRTGTLWLCLYQNEFVGQVKFNGD